LNRPRLLEGQCAAAATSHPEEIDIGVELLLDMNKVSEGDVDNGKV
jgi:hypothetical protein